MSTDLCRCGWDGQGDSHPCHGKQYTCGQPAIPRFIQAPGAVPGFQMKFIAYQTFACDSCWDAYKADSIVQD